MVDKPHKEDRWANRLAIIRQMEKGDGRNWELRKGRYEKMDVTIVFSIHGSGAQQT